MQLKQKWLNEQCGDIEENRDSKSMQEEDNSAGNELLSYRLFELKEIITIMKTEKNTGKMIGIQLGTLANE